MTRFTLGLATLLALNFASNLKADVMTYNYQYEFASGDIVSGQLDGEQNGIFIENVENVSVFFNGTEMPGTVFTARYTGSTWENGPIVSFDPLENNFLFINDDIVNGGGSYDSYIFILNDDVYFDQAVAQSVPLNFSAGESTITSSWSLTPATPVPEPASLALWSILGTAGLGYIRSRRRKQAG